MTDLAKLTELEIRRARLIVALYRRLGRTPPQSAVDKASTKLQ